MAYEQELFEGWHRPSLGRRALDWFTEMGVEAMSRIATRLGVQPWQDPRQTSMVRNATPKELAASQRPTQPLRRPIRGGTN